MRAELAPGEQFLASEALSSRPTPAMTPAIISKEKVNLT